MPSALKKVPAATAPLRLDPEPGKKAKGNKKKGKNMADKVEPAQGRLPASLGIPEIENGAQNQIQIISTRCPCIWFP